MSERTCQWQFEEDGVMYCRNTENNGYGENYGKPCAGCNSEFKDGQKMFRIEELYFFLPDDYDSNSVADALEALAKKFRESKGADKIKEVREVNFLNSCLNFLYDDLRVTGRYGLNEYSEEEHTFKNIKMEI